MPDLLITCPQTGRPVRTGISIDPEQLAALDMEGREVGCPACGETHLWQKSETFFAEQ